MSNPIVDSLLASLQQGVIDAAKTAGAAAEADAATNGKAFLVTALPTIQRWVEGYMANPQTLTSDDIQTLIKDLAFDALVHVITIGGKLEVHAEATQNTILKLATGIASSAIGKLIPL